MKSFQKLHWLLPFLVFTHLGYSQPTSIIKGHVLDADTKQPLPQCNVYVNNTTIGTTTTLEGYFELTNIPAGSNEIVFSFVGYLSQVLTLQPTSPDSLLVVSLEPKKEVPGEIEAKSKPSKGWEKKYRRFEELFLGTDEFGQMSEILNPWVIDIEESQVRSRKNQQVASNIPVTTARANEPITIVNRATGYKLVYELRKFEHSSQQFVIDGNTQFIPLKAESPNDLELWEANRRKVYFQSPAYLFRLLLFNQHEEEGFTVLHPASSDTPLENLTADDFTVSFSYLKQVTWDSVRSRYQVSLGKNTLVKTPNDDGEASLLEVNGGNLYFSPDFTLLNPHDLTMQGSLAKQNIARLLPVDFMPTSRPPQNAINERTDLVEKVYLHLDKPHYFPGDTIWFKAYAHLSVASPQISPLYVELFDTQTAELITAKIIRLTNGFGFGELAIPDSVVNTHVTLRAYTHWMKNFQDDFFFHKDFPVFERIYSSNVTEKIAKDLDLQFFPEGGELNDGLQSRVAFKAIDPTGKGLDVEGFVINQKNDTIVNFQSTHLGMGSFFFKPNESDLYSAYAKTKNSSLQKFDFPLNQPSGFVMQVDNISSEAEVKVYIYHNLPKTSSLEKLQLIGQLNGQTVTKFEFEKSDGGDGIAIPKADLGSGILALTLQTSTGLNLCERLVYVNPKYEVNAQFSTDKPKYAPRENVTLKVSLQSPDNKPVQGNFSVAVTDAGQVTHPEYAEDILSYFNLTSELKGFVEQPGRYFDPANRSAKIELDLVMLTHGWRRHHWRNVMQDIAADPEFLPETGLAVSGRVTKLNEREIKEPHEVTLMIHPETENYPLIHEGRTDSTGFFSFLNLDFFDSVDVFVQAYTEKEKKDGSYRTSRVNKITPIHRNIPTFNARKPQNFLFKSDTSYIDFDDDYIVKIDEAYEIRNKYMLDNDILLKGVTISARKSLSKMDHRDVQYGGKPSVRMEIKDMDVTYYNIYHYLRGKAAGVTVVGNVFALDAEGNPPYIVMRGELAQILIDGQPINPIGAFFLNMAEVEKVDIIKGLAANAVFGTTGKGGTINILTKMGSPNRALIDPRANQGNVSYSIDGYAMPLEFYVPKFDREVPQEMQLDYRSTIYWAPFVFTDEDGEAIITFPLTDGRTDVRVVLEGFDENLAPVQAKYNFSME